MANPVADIVSTGIGLRLSDDFAWTLLPDTREDAWTLGVLGELQTLGPYGQPVPNVYDTAVAASNIVPGELRWHGDFSDAREQAIDRWRREQGGAAGGPIP